MGMPHNLSTIHSVFVGFLIRPPCWVHPLVYTPPVFFPHLDHEPKVPSLVAGSVEWDRLPPFYPLRRLYKSISLNSNSSTFEIPFVRAKNSIFLLPCIRGELKQITKRKYTQKVCGKERGEKTRMWSRDWIPLFLYRFLLLKNVYNGIELFFGSCWVSLSIFFLSFYIVWLVSFYSTRRHLVYKNRWQHSICNDPRKSTSHIYVIPQKD